ncbi:MAG: hypothetical protein A2X67_15110 [Ignavibacteria bacterium GWA2_55_11]|nr:MAG: hypothetical protein A2X67_15110 [Ignavibacteria bacterium GWA2_55_11]OGU45320.1 MAG: hypothetical protein A2X68_02080 [Ignavibacteria bacterium GWC2_56_12]OGU73583.1 MAG: hypothetical protein A3G43_00680 [Ignavibacteria bacterium RIFCSPLOWO2_12_FULL_56_21]OGU74114.1 MAG: hypothetical protein A3H45_07050 [Ignavibacteria bacterium RIFCSPLOWO2_02_FULL_55_14]
MTTAVQVLLSVGASILPVAVFLGGLVVLDSYKLVRRNDVLLSLAVGAVAAFASLAVYKAVLALSGIALETYIRYVAPLVEESLKAAYIIVLLRRKSVGFLVDAGIIGFALGAGFAIVENTTYVMELASASPAVWIVRGFGTAVMHGGTTALVAIVAKSVADARSTENMLIALPGLGIAAVLHSFFNHFFFTPIINTAVILLGIPLALGGAFMESEKRTQEWLGAGFDSDANLLATILKGNVAQTPVGQFLDSLQQRFTPEVVVDLLCYLRLHCELAIQAKGVLMMRSTGFDVPLDPTVSDKFKELTYLEHSIGATGKLALRPIIRSSSQDVWQLRVLQA